MDKRITALFALSRISDIASTHITNPTPSSEMSPVGSFFLTHWGEFGMYLSNICICVLIYLFARKAKLPIILKVGIILSFLVAISNTLFYFYPVWSRYLTKFLGWCSI